MCSPKCTPSTISATRSSPDRSAASSWARAVSVAATNRRDTAEREVLVAAEEVEVNPLVLVYLNRLSDLLFILARAANAGAAEPLWKPGNTR